VPLEDPVLTLRTFYIEEALVAEIAAALWRGGGTVAFRDPRIDDAATVARLAAAHRALDRQDLEAEEQASRTSRRSERPPRLRRRRSLEPCAGARISLSAAPQG
jgi:hypothetical protein